MNNNTNSTTTEVLEAAAAKISSGTKVRYHAFRVTNHSGDPISPAPAKKSNKLEVCVKVVNDWAQYGVRCVVIDSETGLQVR